MGSACCRKTTDERANREDITDVVDASPVQGNVGKEETDWERLGGEELERPLLDELVKCVDSRFLLKLYESGGRIERMQDLPDTAFIGLEDLKGLGTYRTSIFEPAETIYEWLPVIILSYSWLGRAHPDPHAETLEVLVKALKRMKPHGVIIDFTSLPQVPRTDGENKRFKDGLQQFNVFYSHPHTLVLQVTDFPEGYPSARSYDLPEGHMPAQYQDRGWCFAEACISSLGKTPKFLCNLSILPSYQEWVVGKCTNPHTPPPLCPSAFNEELAKKAFTQKKTDFARVQKLYESAFSSRILQAKRLMFAGLHWEPEDIQCFAQAIKENDQVQHLDLSSNEVGKEGAMELSRVMELHWTLSSLKLVTCKLRGAGAGVLGQALKVNTSLRTLELARNLIGDDGARSLADALQFNAALTSLTLGYNQIGEGARALAEALKVNTTLTALELEQNQIGNEDVRSLAEALKVNTVLTHLHLGYNKVGAEGARSLAAALQVNGALTTLELDHNQIRAEGAQPFAEALKDNSVLANLNLCSNQIGAEAVQSLTEALKVNSALTMFNLLENRMGPEGKRSLTEAARQGCKVKC